MKTFHRALRAHAATAVLALSALLPLGAQAAPVSFDVAGLQSLGTRGAAGNSVFNLDVGAGARIVGLSYDVDITAFAPSWLSELSVAFSDSAQAAGVELAPGTDESSGTAAYAGSYDLVALGMDFLVGADGMLRLEFFDSFFDAATVAGDGVWNFGTITIDVAEVAEVPEPASFALVGMALFALGATTLRRRSS